MQHLKKIIPIFNIPGTLFGDIFRNFMGIFYEYSTNTFFPDGQWPFYVITENDAKNENRVNNNTLISLFYSLGF